MPGASAHLAISFLPVMLSARLDTRSRFCRLELGSSPTFYAEPVFSGFSWDQISLRKFRDSLCESGLVGLRPNGFVLDAVKSELFWPFRMRDAFFHEPVPRPPGLLNSQAGTSGSFSSHPLETGQVDRFPIKWNWSQRRRTKEA